MSDLPIQIPGMRYYRLLSWHRRDDGNYDAAIIAPRSSLCWGSSGATLADAITAAIEWLHEYRPKADTPTPKQIQDLAAQLEGAESD